MTNSLSLAALPWVVLGTGSSKRTRGLQAAREKLGLGPARMLEWRDWLESPNLLAKNLREPCVLKVEPPGDDVQAYRQLLKMGRMELGSPAFEFPEHGEFALGNVWFQGFSVAMQRLEIALLEAPHAVAMNTPSDMLAMTDKWRCQQHLQAQGVSTPQLLGLVNSCDDFMTLLDRHQLDRAFLKPRYGSSAAGVVAYRRSRRGQEQATSSAHLVRGTGASSGPRLFNDKRIRTYSQSEEIRLVMDLVADQGAYAEAWVAKPRFGAGHFDLRVVTLGGQAAHRVARISARPMTNLHLDSTRADPATLLGTDEIRLLEFTAEHAAGAFPRSHVTGFDLVVRPGAAQVLEANAFGDLLPGLLWQGFDTYASALQLRLQLPA